PVPGSPGSRWEMGAWPGLCSFADILPVGSRQPEGNGRWGHADLAGSMWEWFFDYSDSPSVYINPCVDCAKATEGTDEFRLNRSGAFIAPVGSLNPTLRSAPAAGGSTRGNGARCARNP